MGIRSWLGFTPPNDLADRQTRSIGAALAVAGPSGISMGGMLTTNSGSSTNAVAYRCVQAIAGNAASLNIVIDGQDGSPVDGHPIAELINRNPNPAMSARVFKEVLFARLEWRGETFVYLDRGETAEGDVQAVWPIFGTVEPVVTKTATGDVLSGFRVTAGGIVYGLLASEVLWLRYPDSDSMWGATAPWEAARAAALLDVTARSWQEQELVTGGNPRSVIYIGDVDEAQHTAASAQWNAVSSGPRSAKRHLVVSGPVPPKVERIGATAEEMSYLGSRLANADEVMLAFGVPRDYLVGGTTYENRTAAKRTLWTDTILPKLEVVASEIDRQMVPDLTQTARFDVSQVDALQENVDAIVARTRSLVALDVILIDEARAYIKLDPMPNGAGAQTLTAYRSQYKATPESQAAASRAQRRILAEPREARAKEVLDRGNIDSVYRRHERVGQRAVERLAEKQERVVQRAAAKFYRTIDLTTMEEIRATGVPTNVFDSAYWNGQTEEILDAWLAGVWDEGGSRTASALGIDFNLYDKQVTREMKRRAKTLAKQVNATTKQALEQGLLVPGVESGESIPKLSDRISSVFTDLAGYRADRIARTETVGGFNAASRVGAVESGIVTQRMWETASDDRVRPSHAAQHGYRTKGMDDRYPNGLLHPGDPAGGDESIQCRCVEIYVVDYSKVKGEA